ncbi:hypothetical protein BHE74_00032657, partial [Ensete ventricosum]
LLTVAQPHRRHPQQSPAARLPCGSPRRTPLPPSSSSPHDRRLQPAATPYAIVAVSSPLPPIAHPPSLPSPLLRRCPSLSSFLLAVAHPFFLPSAAADHHIPISPAAAAAPNVDAPAASCRSSLFFLGHAQPQLAALVAATQPLPPFLCSSRSHHCHPLIYRRPALDSALPLPLLPSSPPSATVQPLPANLHCCLSLLLNRCRQPLFSTDSDINRSPRRPPTTRRI